MQSLLAFDWVSTGMKTVAMLLIVLAALLLFLFLLKKYSVFRREAKGAFPIRILSSLPLSPRDRIEVIDISGQKIVLGVSPSGIRFLTRIVERRPSGPDGCES